MVLSIVIPVFNEKNTIAQLIRQVEAVVIDTIEKEIIIVDDCSTDGTREVLEQLATEKNTHIFFHDHNQGKGAALRTGFSQAQGQYVLIQDADLEYNPAEYPKLLRPVFAFDADVVYGSRFITTEARRVVYFWHFLGNQLLTLASNMLTNLNLSDMETCYKLIRKNILDSLVLREDRFGFEPEVTAKLAAVPNIKIFEVGISYNGRTYQEGKKISWKDGWRALWCIIKYKFYKK